MPRSTTLGSPQQSPTVDALQASDMPDLGHEQARAYSREAMPSVHHLISISLPGAVSTKSAARVAAKRRPSAEPKSFGASADLGSLRGGISKRAAQATMKKRAARYKHRLTAVEHDPFDAANALKE